MAQEANYGLTEQAFGGSEARYMADNTLLVRFFKQAALNHGRTQEEGRPIYEDVDWIQIMQPGNKESIIMRPATPRDTQRFAEHYRKFQARQEEEYLDGTPLAEWPGVTRAQVEELAYFNVRTLEQLAGMSDSNAQNIMGIIMLRDKAKAYLEAAAKNATAESIAKLQKRLEALEARNAELEEALAEAEEAVEE